MATQIWRHSKSGEDFIVTLSDQGVTEAAGPLHYSEVQSCIVDGFDSDPELVDELNTNGADYTLFWQEGNALPSANR